MAESPAGALATPSRPFSVDDVLKPPVEGKLTDGKEGVDVGDRLRVQLTNLDVERGFIDFVRSR